MFFPMEIMLQPREMDNCQQEIYNFQRELDNCHGNWIIASGNFPIAVEKMIFPVGDEFFLRGNYLFPISDHPSLMEILVLPYGKNVYRKAVGFFLRGKNRRLQKK
jgi:hypothetical protein